MYIKIDFTDSKKDRLGSGHYILAVVLTVYIFFFNYWSVSKMVRFNREHEVLQQKYKKYSEDSYLLKKAALNPADEIEKINGIISKMGFSWTGFLNVFEKLVPENVKVESIALAPETGASGGRITGSALSVEALTVFINALQRSRNFKDVFLNRQIILEKGKIQFDITYAWVDSNE